MAWHAAQADVRAWAAMLAVKDEAWDEAHWPGLCSSYGTVPSYQIHYASPDLDSLYDMPSGLALVGATSHFDTLTLCLELSV